MFEKPRKLPRGVSRQKMARTVVMIAKVPDARVYFRPRSRRRVSGARARRVSPQAPASLRAAHATLTDLERRAPSDGELAIQIF